MAGGNICVKRLEWPNLVLSLQQLYLQFLSKQISELLQAANILTKKICSIYDSTEYFCFFQLYSLSFTIQPYKIVILVPAKLVEVSH